MQIKVILDANTHAAIAQNSRKTCLARPVAPHFKLEAPRAGAGRRPGGFRL
jgi:hypothetical protein